MSSAGILRRVALVRTDVSEELSTSIIRETRIGELGTLAILHSTKYLCNFLCSAERTYAITESQNARAVI
jgi:hypothetical protein